MSEMKDLVEEGVISAIVDNVLQEKKHKLRAGKKLMGCFFVSQKQFWSMQSIYDTLKKYKLLSTFCSTFSCIIPYF